MASGEVTPPVIKSAIPTAKEKKYDRQLRLWAASGQEALENAKILLLNNDPGAVGVETLKNLVLPGVGSFTIVDGATVTEPDLGINFFLEESSLGKSRGIETSKYLNELNQEVEFNVLKESPGAFIQENEARLREHSLIILIGPFKELKKISQIASEASVPLFYIHSVGFYSHFSVQLPALFPIVDTHQDPASTQDLRLLNPWPELATYQKTKMKEVALLEDYAHGHIPYVVLLLHYLEEWKASHDGKPPSNYSEKKEFTKLVSSGARTSNPEGGEENFDEAAAAVLKSLNPPSISTGLREIFQETTWETLTPESSTFWWIACAINDFHKSHDGFLPLPGTLPDMKSQSTDYIQLQTLYKQKATDDIAEVTANIKSHNPPLEISPIEIAEFCKNAAHVKLIRGRKLPSPWDLNSVWDNREKEFISQLTDETSLLSIYIGFLAYDEYFAPLRSSSSTKHRDSFDDINARAHSIVDNLLESDPSISADDAILIRNRLHLVVEELHRGFKKELHNIASLTGGMVAQEVIKVLTKQYVPVDNTCVFDGLGSRTAVFRIGNLV